MKKVFLMMIVFFVLFIYACTKDQSEIPKPFIDNTQAKKDSLANVDYINKIMVITDRCAAPGCHTANKESGIGNFTSYSGIKSKISRYTLAGFKSKALGIMSDCSDYECLNATEKQTLENWLNTYF
jgi:hypothetical protein